MPIFVAMKCRYALFELAVERRKRQACSMITDHIHTVAAGWRGAGLLIHIPAIAIACGWWDTCCLSIPVDIDIHTHVIAGVICAPCEWPAGHVYAC